ncbi:MAG: YraN family protein [Bacteroidales bacterium]|jgi:putative endonuclease
MAQSHNLGKEGEDAAAGYLEKKGYKILHRNWKAGKLEVDIIAEIDQFIVFVEVKTRSDDFIMHPLTSVNRDKQRSLVFCADGYIRKYNISKECRFDVITVIRKGESFQTEHIENAFYPTLR